MMTHLLSFHSRPQAIIVRFCELIQITVLAEEQLMRTLPGMVKLQHQRSLVSVWCRLFSHRERGEAKLAPWLRCRVTRLRSQGRGHRR